MRRKYSCPVIATITAAPYENTIALPRELVRCRGDSRRAATPSSMRRLFQQGLIYWVSRRAYGVAYTRPK